MEFTYKVYSPEYRERVLKLLDGLWHFNDNMKDAYFRWKYEQNPFADSVKGYMALDGEKVVAFRGYMMLPVTFEGKSFLNAQLSDTVTDSNYRRMGLFKNVTDFSLRELEKDSRVIVSLNSSSGGPTLGGYLKLGWRPLSEREHLFRISIANILKNRRGKGWDADELTEEKNGMTFQLARSFNAREIISLPGHVAGITHERTLDFYKWRFENPREKYMFATVRDNGGKVLAFAAFDDFGSGRFDLMDFLYSDKKVLKQMLDWVFKKSVRSYITLWTVGKNNVIYRNAGYFGFRHLNMLLRHFEKFRKPPYLVRPIGKSDFPDIADSSNWDLFKVMADEN